MAGLIARGSGSVKGLKPTLRGWGSVSRSVRPLAGHGGAGGGSPQLPRIARTALDRFAAPPAEAFLKHGAEIDETAVRWQMSSKPTQKPHPDTSRAGAKQGCSRIANVDQERMFSNLSKVEVGQTLQKDNVDPELKIGSARLEKFKQDERDDMDAHDAAEQPEIDRAMVA